MLKSKWTGKVLTNPDESQRQVSLNQQSDLKVLPGGQAGQTP